MINIKFLAEFTRRRVTTETKNQFGYYRNLDLTGCIRNLGEKHTDFEISEVERDKNTQKVIDYIKNGSSLSGSKFIEKHYKKN